jgi:hypothetical protein
MRPAQAPVAFALEWEDDPAINAAGVRHNDDLKPRKNLEAQPWPGSSAVSRGSLMATLSWP